MPARKFPKKLVQNGGCTGTKRHSKMSDVAKGHGVVKSHDLSCFEAIHHIKVFLSHVVGVSIISCKIKSEKNCPVRQDVVLPTCAARSVFQSV